MLIPEHEQRNAIDLLWRLARTTESRAKPENVLDRHEVESVYIFLNRLGINAGSPRWMDDSE